MQTFDTTIGTNSVTAPAQNNQHSNHFFHPSSPPKVAGNAMEGEHSHFAELEEQTHPFRPINIEHIENSSNGKHGHLQFGSPFRRPMGGSSGSGGSSKGKTGTNGKTPLSGGSSQAKNCMMTHHMVANSETGINVFRFNTDLKIPMRTANKEHHQNQTCDENMPSGLSVVPLYPSSERKTKG